MNNTFEVEFAQIYKLIESVLTSDKEKELKKTLLKLNNPNFYGKFTRAHPMHEHGYYTNKTINPILISIRNMLKTLRENTDYSEKIKSLQVEFSWAYHEYQKSVGFFRKSDNTKPVN